MILQPAKKLYDVNGNWIGMIQEALLTKEEYEYYNRHKEFKDESGDTNTTENT